MEVLTEAPKYASIENQFQLAIQIISDKIVTITEINELDLNGWEQSLDFPEVDQTKEALTGVNENISKFVAGLRETLEAASQDISIRHEEFRTRHDAFKIKYEEANTAQSQLAVIVNKSVAYF